MQRLSRFVLVLICGAACGTKATSSDPPPATGSAGSDTAGSARRLRDQILGVNAHVAILKTVSEVAEYRDVLAVVERMETVVAAEPFIFVEGMLAGASGAPIAIALKGVDPQRVGKVLDLGANMKTGKLDDLAAGGEPAIILGDVLAGKLGVRIGDRVTFGRPEIPAQPTNEPAVTVAFRVAGTFHVGFDEYDERLGYCSLAAAQTVMNRGDHVMGVELKVKDIDRAAMVADVLEKTLGGPPYRAIDWYELNRELFTTLFGERRP